jgi:hypothetical protein
MTVYWVDPYIDTPKGGIHGTTSTTTRNGNYATPFGLTELFGANALIHLNGTSLYSGDEIRLKGQPLTDFYYNIGTTGNTIDITSIDSNSMDYASTDHQYVATYKTALAATGDTVPALIIHDPGLLGTNKFMLHQGRNTFSNVTNYIPFYSNVANALWAWLRAKTGIDVNDNVKVAFVDPAYVFDYNAAFSSNPDNAFNLNVSAVTVTDGWVSSTSRGGFTMLPITAGGSHNLNIDWWNSSNKYGLNFDMPSTFINWYHPSSNWIASLKQRQRFYSITQGRFHLGQWGHNTTSAWNTVTINSTTLNSAENDTPCIEFGNFINSRYLQISGTGTSTVAQQPIVKFSNMFMGSGSYVNALRYKMVIGNMMQNQPYTGGVLIYNNNTDGQIDFLENSHIYGYQNSAGIIYTPLTNGLTIPASVTNYASSDANYPGATINSSGGPKYASALSPSQYMVDNVTANRIAIAPAAWSSAAAINMHETTHALYSYSYGQWNNSIGILDCGSTDYKTTNANILLVNMGYTDSSRFSGQNMHFAGNTYDGAPLALWSQRSTVVNAPYSALLSYNNAAGDMVVMMSSAADENKDHLKSFVFQLPDLSSATSLSVSYTITRSSSALTDAPLARLFYIKNNLSGILSDEQPSTSLSGNVYTYYNTVINLDPDARFMGLKIMLKSGTGRTVADTYTISAPTFTVS